MWASQTDLIFSHCVPLPWAQVHCRASFLFMRMESSCFTLRRCASNQSLHGFPRCSRNILQSAVEYARYKYTQGVAFLDLVSAALPCQFFKQVQRVIGMAVRCKAHPERQEFKGLRLGGCMSLRSVSRQSAAGRGAFIHTETAVQCPCRP